MQTIKIHHVILGVLTTFGLVVLPAPRTFGQQQLWINQFGTSADDMVYALAPDEAGGVFAGGRTMGDLGGASAGGYDYWLGRYDGAGNEIWVRQYGSSHWEWANALASDGAGGVFIAGTTYGNLGAPAGIWDAWLAYYDGAGNRMWITQLGTDQYDEAFALVSDGAGGVFVAGRTQGALVGPNKGVDDAWLARYNGSGSQLWVKQMGTGAYDAVHALASDGAGGVWIGGNTGADLAGPYIGGRSDAWIARYNAAGNKLSIKQLGSDGWDGLNAMSADGAGGVWIAGFTYGSLGNPNAGQSDVWLAHYDESGAEVRVTQFGSSGHDEARVLGPDGAGGVWMGGNTDGNLQRPNIGEGDVWLARCNADGIRTWIDQLGTAQQDDAGGLAINGAGGVFFGGYTLGEFGGPTAGGIDAWLSNYEVPQTPWNDDFDAYPLGLVLSNVGGWTGWDNRSTYAGVVSDSFCMSFPHSICVSPINGGPVHEFTGVMNGQWRMTLLQYLPSTFTNDQAYVVINNVYEVPGPKEWAVRISCDPTLGKVLDDLRPEANDIDILYDQWVEFHFEIDLDADTIDTYYDGRLLSTGQYTIGAGPAEIRNINFSTDGLASAPAYYDDIRLDNACYPDCDVSTGAGVLDVFDFLCLQSSFVNGEPYACDCDLVAGVGVCDIFDFLCFQDAFVGGCP